MQRLKGIGVSPGVVSGRAVVLMQRAQVLRYRVAHERIADELARLDQSRLRSRQQLQDIRARIGRRRGPELAALFDAQLLMLDDPMLVPRAEALVRDTLDNVFKLGTMNALTGPIARGDHAVVARQLDALQAADAPLAEVYRALGVVAVELSRQQGGASEAALTILRDLLQPPRNL